jgi:hypothetical protein
MNYIVREDEANIMECVRLPCDGMFGGSARMVESFERDETVRQARVTKRSCPVTKETDREEVHQQMVTQRQSAIV